MQRERQQLICLGDDSPMLGIYSIRGGGRQGMVGGGVKGQVVWDAARAASSLRHRGVVVEKDRKDNTWVKEERRKRRVEKEGWQGMKQRKRRRRENKRSGGEGGVQG